MLRTGGNMKLDDFPLLTDAGPRTSSTTCGQHSLLVSEGGTNNPLNGSPSPLFCTPCSVVGLEPAVRLELTYLHSIKNGLIPGIRLHYPYMLY